MHTEVDMCGGRGGCSSAAPGLLKFDFRAVKGLGEEMHKLFCKACMV